MKRQPQTGQSGTGSKDVPVLLLNFNRPEKSANLLSLVRRHQPKHLFVFCDGPRAGSLSDLEKVERVRELYIAGVDWQCELHLLFLDENLGCRKGVTKALTWFFDEVPAGIVLEDDLEPGRDFFDFCAEMLLAYRSDERVWGVAGDNSFLSKPPGGASYGFTQFPLIWGWATWADRWKRHRDSFDPTARIRLRCLDKQGIRFIEEIQTALVRESLDSWAYPLLLSVTREEGLWIYPRTNLIENKGFGGEATHTRSRIAPRSFVPAMPLGERIHPISVQLECARERRIFRRVFGKSRLWVWHVLVLRLKARLIGRKELS